MIDLMPWDRMLQNYVDHQGRVDYRRWQQAAGALTDWLRSLQGLELDELTPEQTLAVLINLYNALVIQQVLAVYPIRSIRPTVLGMPNWIAFLRFFSRSIFQLQGQPISLNQIEHQQLRLRFTEPRLHFALVCAARGCPWLRPQAYWPDSVDHQLETDAQQFITNPEKVRYDPATQTLYCSKIFQWYGQDFLQVAPTIAAYIAPYLPWPEGVIATATIRYLPYDWDLNQRTSS